MPADKLGAPNLVPYPEWVSIRGLRRTISVSPERVAVISQRVGARQTRSRRRVIGLLLVRSRIQYGNAPRTRQSA